VYIDTSALLALLNADDELHSDALAAYARLTSERAPLVVSGWVIAEFLNGASAVSMRASAVRLYDALRESPRVVYVEVSQWSWEAALALYRSRPDKAWSLIDCASIWECEQRGVRRVFTRDHHFRQAGLETLL
jgi:predicted nucleic acid-binding protein